MDRVFSISVPAEACQLKIVRAFFKSALSDALGSLADDVILAVDESCSNVVKHRPPDSLEQNLDVSAEVAADRVRFRISCFCKEADVVAIHPRDLHAVRPGGLGTHFVNSIMDSVTFEPSSTGSKRMDLVLEKSLPEAP